MPQSHLLKISEIAQALQLPSSTIRHYTEMGLLRVAGYTEGGQRLYLLDETTICLAKIQSLSKQGKSLPEIKAELTHRELHKKVLVVDDDVDMTELILDLLKNKYPDWQVDSARDGFTAGKAIVNLMPDLVILDLMLPGVDGFQVCRQIREEPSFAGMKVIAITGYDSPGIKEKIIQCGANDYLAKPMDNHDLLQKIQQVLALEH